VRRLLEYQQIRELVEWLGAAAARRASSSGAALSRAARRGRPRRWSST